MGAGPEVTIYLDNLASTPIDPRVARHQAETALAFPGNPNSAEHASGQAAQGSLSRSRSAVGRLLDRPADEVLLTPTASAALWTAVQDAIGRSGQRPIRVLASAIEHPSLLKHLVDVDRDGRILLTLFPVDPQGQPDLDGLRRLSRDGVDLVCMMAANNEIGTIAPVRQVLAIAREHGARTLVDASQAAGRMAIADDLAEADLVVLSGAKMYGPRMGALCGALTRRTAEVTHAMFGTPDVAAAAALALACDLRRQEMNEDELRLAALRDRLEATLLDGVPGLVVNGDPGHRLAGALHASCPDLPGEAVIARLQGRVDLSSGAACQSGVPGPSHVLTAMRLPHQRADGAVRMCVGKFNTEEDVELAGDMIVDAMLSGHAAARRRA